MKTYDYQITLRFKHDHSKDLNTVEALGNQTEQALQIVFKDSSVLWSIFGEPVDPKKYYWDEEDWEETGKYFPNNK